MNGLFNLDSPIMRFLSKVCDLMILNVMCIICCLPIVTAGASITALYTITMKMVRGEESYIFKGFLKAFKENFKQSTIIWLIMAVLGIFVFVDYQAASLLPENMSNLFRILIGALIIFYLMVLSYIFRCQYGRKKNRTWREMGKYFQKFSVDCNFKSAMDHFSDCTSYCIGISYFPNYHHIGVWKYAVDASWICRGSLY